MITEQIGELRNTLTHILASATQLSDYDVKVGNATYDSNSVTFKLRLVDKAAIGGRTKEEHEFIENGKVYGFKEEDLHKTVTINGKSMEIMGWDDTRRMTNIIMKDTVGKRWLYKIYPVLNALGRHASRIANEIMKEI